MLLCYAKKFDNYLNVKFFLFLIMLCIKLKKTIIIIKDLSWNHNDYLGTFSQKTSDQMKYVWGL